MNRSLNEYDFMKVVCIVLVLLGHVCSMYMPTGAVVIDVSPTIIYIRDLIYKVFCHMPIFCAISGAIYCIQIQKNKYQETRSFIKNKALRLLVPYIIFATFYVFPTMLFVTDIESPFKYYVDSYVLTHDTRHLWFLLMLFQMFVIIHFFKPLIKDNETIWLGICLGAFFVIKYLSIHYYELFKPSYLLWFYMGYYFQYKIEYMEKIKDIYIIPIMCVPFIMNMFNIRFPFSTTLYPFFIFASLLKIGILAKNSKIFDNRISKELSANGMGIYLFHPMIIYVTASAIKHWNIPNIISYTLLLFVSVTISLFLTKIIKKMRLSWVLGE